MPGYVSNYLTTYSGPYHVARALGGADTPIDLTTEGNFAQKPDESQGVLDLFKEDVLFPVDAPVFPETKINGICFIFAATAAHSKLIDWRLIAWRNSNGPAEIVANGTAETGTQAVVIYPHNVVTATAFWCDNIVISNEYWMKEIEATAVSGNSISKLWMDTIGYRYWKMEITLPVSNPAILAACFYGFF